MKKKVAALLVILTVLCFLAVGCGGGGARIENPSNHTLGQELTDLDKAYKEGIITKSEYIKAKKNLFKRYR